MSLQKLQVKPIYGWGWFRHGDDRAIDTPPSFELEAEIDGSEGRFRAIGKLELPGHLLDGLWVRVSQRHTEWDGDCNLGAYSSVDSRGEDWIYAGYAQVPQ